MFQPDLGKLSSANSYSRPKIVGSLVATISMSRIRKRHKGPAGYVAAREFVERSRKAGDERGK